MLFTRSILSEPEEKDGFRISVMSRHTLSDGKTPDVRISPRHFDLHIPHLGPSPHLIGKYVRNKIDWPTFAGLYFLEIRHSFKNRTVKFLAKSAMVQDITILCIEEASDKCHRRLLAEECQEYQPGLIIKHR